MWRGLQIEIGSRQTAGERDFAAGKCQVAAKTAESLVDTVLLVTKDVLLCLSNDVDLVEQPHLPTAKCLEGTADGRVDVRLHLATPERAM